MHSTIGAAAVLDIETTGFSAATEEILELAVVLFHYDRRSGRVLERVSGYCGRRQPTCRISRGAYQVHGITRRSVQGLRLDYRQIRAMLRQADFVVSHNADFDRGFVQRLMPSARTKIWLCSMRGIDWRAKGLTSRCLDDLARAHKIKNVRPHRADGDTDTLLALLSHRRRFCRTRLYELLRNARLTRGHRQF